MIYRVLLCLLLPQEAVNKRDQYAVNRRVQEITKSKRKEIDRDVFEVVADGLMTFCREYVGVFKKVSHKRAETSTELHLMSQTHETDQKANDLTGQNEFQKAFAPMIILLIMFRNKEEKQNSYRQNGEQKVDQ